METTLVRRVEIPRYPISPRTITHRKNSPSKLSQRVGVIELDGRNFSGAKSLRAMPLEKLKGAALTESPKARRSERRGERREVRSSLGQIAVESPSELIRREAFLELVELGEKYPERMKARRPQRDIISRARDWMKSILFRLVEAVHEIRTHELGMFFWFQLGTEKILAVNVAGCSAELRTKDGAARVIALAQKFLARVDGSLCLVIHGTEQLWNCFDRLARETFAGTCFSHPDERGFTLARVF